MPPERVRRQQPVSCSHCRGRKLRCDRQLPCSSCRSRDIACVYASQRPALNAYGETSNGDTPPAGNDELRDLRAEHDALKARFCLIERIVLDNHGQSLSRMSSAPVVENHTAVQEPRPPISPESDYITECVADPQWLERVGAQNSSRTSGLVNALPVRVSALQHIMSTVFQAAPGDPLLIPSLAEALELKRVYLQRPETIQHIFYEQHVGDAITQLYRDIQNERSYRSSHLALLLGILASVAETCDLIPVTSVAHELATYWLKGSLDVIENVWRSQTSDLEIIQAIAITIYRLYHTEAFSSKARLLHATAVSLAKDIGLHKTDSAVTNSGRTLTRGEIIHREICRRVWWHLVAIDWGFLLSSGLHQGSYSINPRHMRVQKPRHINDDDITFMPADAHRPTTEPTSMTYYLHAIRIAEVCREVADITWDLESTEMDDTLYDRTIRPLDDKFQDLLATTPPSLLIDGPDRGTHGPQVRMTMQRYCNYLSIQTKRCRLHLPYLMRTSHYQSYQFSRSICLDAARSILKLRESAPNPESGPLKSSSAAWRVGFLPHFFFATTILVVDYSFNRNALDEAERKAEIQSACTVFENASPSASSFLDVLKAVMQKHKLQVRANPLGKTGDASPRGDSAAVVYSQYTPIEMESPIIAFDADMGLNELWHNYLDTDPGLQEWDDLFSHLDAGVQ